MTINLDEQLEWLTSIGVPPIMVDMLLSMNDDALGRPHLSADERRWLVGPIIYHSRSSRDPDHPARRWKPHIYTERLRWVTGRSRFKVGPCELAMVMFDASLEHPFGHDLSTLYLWACQNAIKAQQTNSGLHKDADPRLWALPLESRVYTDDDILNDHAVRSAYNALAGEVRRKVIAHAKLNERAQRKAAAGELVAASLF